MIPRHSSHVTELNNSFVQEQERLNHERQRKRRGLKRRLAVLGIISVILGSAVLVTINTQASSLNEKLAEKAELEQKLGQLQRNESALRQEIKNYNDREYIAEVARRDYYLSNEGEILFKLPH
ncbi:MAG TPA: septum formation initiator family protein [Bacilli bacterium]|nr:septum formation initiator family protein [Bacilli bacterium]